MFSFQEPQVPGVANLIIKHGEKDYDLLSSSFKNEDIVVNEQETIEKQLRLNDLSKYISSLGVFLRIAHCAVRKHASLRAEVQINYTNIHELCCKTAVTLTKFQNDSDNAVQSLQTAYDLVKKSEEKQASKILKKLQEMSEKLKKKARKLSEKCKKQSENIQGLMDSIMQQQGEIINEQNREMEDLMQTCEDIQILQSQKLKAQSEIVVEFDIVDELELPDEMYEIIERFNEKDETHKVAFNSLEVTLNALKKINITMTNVGHFWEIIKALCKSMMTISMEVQVERLSNMESQHCQNDDSFWKDALDCYIKWFVLKEVCATTFTSVNRAVKVIEEYATENPNEEETYRDIDEMAQRVKKRLLSQQSYTDQTLITEYDYPPYHPGY